MWTSTGTQTGGYPDQKGVRVMSAQTPYLEVDAIGVLPTLFLLFVLFLTALGMVAHAAFV